MTDEQADELLKNNDWAKWSDARELLMEAAHRGAMAERKNLETELRRLHHNNQVLKNALWKACGDDEEVVNSTIASEGELK